MAASCGCGKWPDHLRGDPGGRTGWRKMKFGRRGFLRVLGASPLAAKAAVDAEIAALTGTMTSEVGNAAVGLSYGPPPSNCISEMPYERRLIGAAEYVKMFGLPEHVEADYRDNARYVAA